MGCGASTLAGPQPKRIEVRPHSSSDAAVKRVGHATRTSPEPSEALDTLPPVAIDMHGASAVAPGDAELNGEFYVSKMFMIDLRRLQAHALLSFSDINSQISIEGSEPKKGEFDLPSKLSPRSHPP